MATFKDTIGLRIKLKLNIDLTAGGTVSVVALKPDGTSVTWVAVIEDAAAGLIYYDTLSGDLDQAGLWKVNAKWGPTAGGTFYGETACFSVHELGDTCS